ncbi:hypothetical protein E4T50_09019 [Aureobasidium sp. EXF-12298]|nr:hypothetical protein E4T50_09019 [Aureobasidium sp. EXF-12298]
MCLEDNLAYAHWAALTTIKAAMHTRFASTRERPMIPAAAKLPWHTNHLHLPSQTWHSYIALHILTFFFGTHILPQHVTGGWVEGLGTRARLISDRSGLSTCVQQPPSNIRYLLASDIIINRF